MTVATLVAASGRRVSMIVLRSSRSAVASLLELSGFTTVAYGVWTVSRPAGIITGGLFAVLMSFLIDRAGGRR